MSEVARLGPVIGVTCYVEPVDRGDWHGQMSATLPTMYAAQVECAGGLVVVLPPPAVAGVCGLADGEDEAKGGVLDEQAAAVLSRVDGLVLAGGVDVESSRYGAAPHPSVQQARTDRDDWELALARVSASTGIPTLGICRGMQVMAVAAGASLEQHLPDRVGSDVHSPLVGAFDSHPVTPVAGSRVADVLGSQERQVPTYHHQAVAPESLLETGYVPAAWHTDGTLEAMEAPAAPFRLAVQWHPEAGTDPRLFQALVAAATRVRT